MFSRRSHLPREANALARARARWGAAPLLDLTASNPTEVGLEGDVAPLATAARSAEASRYAPSPFGLPRARAAVARFAADDGVPTPAEHVVLTASTSEAYGFLFKLLCDAGDEVLVPEPSYPLFEHLTRLEGVRPVAYPLRYDGRWHVSLEELAAARSERTRAVLVVHPNNPTGSLFEGAELEGIVATGLPVISDEVFAAYRHGTSQAPRSVLQVAGGGLAFALGGLSKQAALPQLKLAWIAAGGDAARVAEALARLELIADSYLSVATPVQLALDGLLQASRPVTERIRARLSLNLATLDAALASCRAIDRLHLDAGWYATLRLPATRSDEAWALELLERDGVLVQPGYFYDFEGGPFVVLSLLPRPEPFRAAVKRLVTRVEAALDTSG